MEFGIAALVGLVLFGLLANRYGYDSRERTDSPEHHLAHWGVSWPDATTAQARPNYPTLALIDRARGVDGPAFAGDPRAAMLEPIARALVDEYWNDSVWTTGFVPEPALRRVIELLHQHQHDRRAFVTPPVQAA